jgi:Neuraminidase (sialidase)
MEKALTKICSWKKALGLMLWLAVTRGSLVSQIQVFQTQPADRIVVVEEGGGYFPVICKLKDGEILAAVRGGGPHKFSWGKARVDLVRSVDGGQTWTQPVTVADYPDRDELNPALGQLSDGTVVLAFWSYKGSMDFESHDALKALRGKLIFLESYFYTRRSKDGGRSWDAPVLFQPPTKLGSVYGKIVEIDKVALMTYYSFDPDSRNGSVYLLRSRDGGRNWGDPTLLAQDYNETALAVLPNGRLAAALRSAHGQSVSVCFSDDAGRTWTTPKGVANDNEHPGDLVVLPDNRLILTYGERNRPFGVRALISPDGGKTWDRKNTVVLAWDAPNRDCGYPSSVALDDGRVLTMYYQVNDLDTAPKSAQARAVIWQPPVPK